MGHQVVTEKVAVTKPGDREDTIVHRGAMLPDWVDEFTRFVLTTTGMAKFVQDPDPNLVPPSAAPAPVVLPEHQPPPADASAAAGGAGSAGKQKPPSGASRSG
jgi:hypothetical protein